MLTKEGVNPSSIITKDEIKETNLKSSIGQTLKDKKWNFVCDRLLGATSVYTQHV